MREIFYIDLERRDEVQRKWESMDKEPPVTMDDKLISSFEPQDFPERECLPIKRKWSRAAVRGMING